MVTWEQAFRCTGLVDGQTGQKACAPRQCPLKWGTRALLKPEELWNVEPLLGPGDHRPLHSSACPLWPCRRWKLQVLDLRRNSHQDFWTTWSSITASICSLPEPEPSQPMQKRCRVEAQVGLKPVWAPVQVLVELCLKENTLEQILCYLLKKAKQRRSLMHLCCQKLMIFAMPMQSIRGILKVVQLDSVQDLEVNCTWKLATLGRFMLYLGRMGNLCSCCSSASTSCM